jgi:ceramide glucosyltransferase
MKSYEWLQWISFSFLMILAFLAFLSLALTLWQWWAAQRFPLHQRIRDRAFTPGLTLIKPLKGADAETEPCLRSWLQQDYAGPIQILFGVASPDDPVCPLVRRLIEEHPQTDAQLILCVRALGANAKVSTLVQIQTQAKHDILVISDADVRVPPDFLANVVSPLRDPGVGLVNCFYQLANPTTLAMRWEAVAINADFWSQVLQAQTLKPLDFALGAVMAVPRTRLERIGGFEALLEYLADDYHLGHTIAGQGGSIVLCPVVVECRSPVVSWGAVWTHQLRWARTIRFCQPVPYFFSILSNATLWPAAWLLSQPAWSVFLLILLCLLVRGWTALVNQRKLAPATVRFGFLWLVWLKDLLNAAIWVCSFLGSTVEWRGERFQVQRGGKLVKLGSSTES